MDVESVEATKQALERMQAAGFDLSKSLVVDYFIAVPTEEAGNGVAVAAGSLGFSTSVEADEETGDWTCYCTIEMIPELPTILAYEEQLDDLGRAVGGRGDGFGTFGDGS